MTTETAKNLKKGQKLSKGEGFPVFTVHKPMSSNKAHYFYVTNRFGESIRLSLKDMREFEVVA